MIKSKDKDSCHGNNHIYVCSNIVNFYRKKFKYLVEISIIAAESNQYELTRYLPILHVSCLLVLPTTKYRLHIAV